MKRKDAHDRLLATEAHRFASVLAEGAAEATLPGDDLMVHLVRLPASIRSWAGKQTTLMNHIRVGAYAVIKQIDGSRWLYATSRGTAQVATLRRWSVDPITLITGSDYDELRSRVEHSLHKSMRHATSDGRSRRAIARGFDFAAAAARRSQTKRFEKVVDEASRLEEADELEAFFTWWDAQVDPRVKRMIGGLPVDAEIYRLAEDAGLLNSWNLVTER